jgi:hypothetical protein
MMKKGILSVTGCALALGLVAAPVANAASVSKIKAKESIYHRSINNHLAKSSTKGKESKNFFVSINKNIDKINTNFQVIVQKADSFYSNSNTAEKELDFFDNTLEKLNASSIQLVTIQKQLDRITKKDDTTDDVTTTYEDVNKVEQSITDEINKLSQLHTTFVPVTSTGSDNQGQDSESKKHSKKVLHPRLKEIKNLLVSVNRNANKINSRLQGLDQNVKTFYSNPNTAEKELDFYNGTLEKLIAYSKQLLSFQKQLDGITKKDGTTDDLTTTYEEVSNLQKTITDEITKVNQLHTSFVPVTSGSGNQDPGTGSQNPGTGNQDPGTGSQDPGTGSQDPGTGSQNPGTGSQDPGTGTGN